MAENTAVILEDSTEIVRNTVEIQSLIYVIRGRQVMIDSDLAMLYQVETKSLNRSMKRNIKRFPEDFCFQITKEEFENLRCQFGTSSDNNSGHGGRRYYPYVYTEQGIAMLSAILRSDIAVQVSIKIMKTFVEMRKYLVSNSLVLEKINGLEVHQIQADIQQEAFEKATNERFEQIFNYIEAHNPEKQKIFFDGQIFDAFSLFTELIRRAKNKIVLIDGYVDIGTLNILAKKNNNVSVLIYTLPGARLTKSDIEKFNAQYPKLEVKHTTAFHDRFLLLDDNEGYHIGASIKDAGKKCFGINRMEDTGVIRDILQRAELSV